MEVDMIKRLVSHGNSAALIIDKPIMELLHVDMETPLELATDGRNLIISPVSDVRSQEELRSALNKVNKRHSKTLRKLAE
jgi:antitoxin MazE